MEILVKRRIRNVLAGVAAGAMLMTASAAWASGGPEIQRLSWSFGGLTGHFDKQQLRRGYMVYKNVCVNCHGLKRIQFRNLGQPGGPEYLKEEVEKFATAAMVEDGPNDDGKMFKRPGKTSDRHPSPFANDKEAAAAQNGAVPPDLSNMAKARGAARNVAWFMEPAYWAYDIGTVYQEQGADYIVAMLEGFGEAPVLSISKDECETKKEENYKWDEKAGKCAFNLAEGMNYNAAFPGHQIAMPPPLSDGAVDFVANEAPKSKAECDNVMSDTVLDEKGNKVSGTVWDEKTNKCSMTVARHAKDVAAFLMWTAEPKLEERKRLGLKVLIYLLVLSGLLFLSKRTLWRKVKH